MRRYSIQNKIVLPFIVLFAIVIFVVPLITIALLDRKYGEQYGLETENWLKVIVSTNYIRFDKLIREDSQKIKKAYGVEVTLVSGDNTINHTTLKGLSDEDWSNLSASMKLREAREQIKGSDSQFVLQNVTVGKQRYKVIYYLLPQYNRLLCLMRSMDKIADAKRQVTLLILGIAAIVIVLVTLISHLISKNLATPIKELVQFTRQVAEGQLDQKCSVKTHDEIGDLAAAFNQMTQDLRDSRNELIQAERLATAGKMAASFAHEIRNPLSSMRMLAQMLMRKKDLTESKREQSMQYILEGIERIDVSVKGLMNFARPATLERVEQSLNPVLQEVLNLMESNLSHHQISLVKKFDPNLPPFLFDRDKLKQAFMNIVLNAMEAIQEGGTLEILTARDMDGIRIDVVDTGIGIAPEDQERLFEPFFTRKPQGTGLGLSNAKRILEQHGGDIQINSVVGKGTTVSLWLPLM